MRAKCDALRLIQDSMIKPFEFKPITDERAEALADKIAPDDNDETVHALIELLHGLSEAALKHGDVEGLAMVAAHRAYTKTIHFFEAFKQFAELDETKPRDWCVIHRDFRAEGDEE